MHYSCGVIYLQHAICYSCGVIYLQLWSYLLQLWSYLFAAVELFVTAVELFICSCGAICYSCGCWYMYLVCIENWLFVLFFVFFLVFFSRVLSEIKGRFEPDVVVLQCGADMLSGDPLGSFSLTLRGVGMCATFILQWGIPTLLLGGGW